MVQNVDLDKLAIFTGKIDDLFREHNITEGEANIVINIWIQKQTLKHCAEFIEMKSNKSETP